MTTLQILTGTLIASIIVLDAASIAVGGLPPPGRRWMLATSIGCAVVAGALLTVSIGMDPP
jgi:hypothetical protein